MRNPRHVHMRVAAGVGAWLIGVGAATAGSLLAVSLLGQGIATSQSQQLTESAVQRALAAEASETQGPGPASTGSPSPAPSAARSHHGRLSQGGSEIEATPSAHASRSRPAASPSAQPAPTPSSTLLTSQGGTVVADCRPGGAYLLSWSPAPGYEAGIATRGPALIARVIFNSAANSVTMMVSCATGVPVTTNTIGGYGPGGGGGGDDGGGGGE